jgi:hypothetical protein
MRPVLIAADRLKQFEAIHTGQSDVDQHCGVGSLCQHVERILCTHRLSRANVEMVEQSCDDFLKNRTI